MGLGCQSKASVEKSRNHDLISVRNDEVYESTHTLPGRSCPEQFGGRDR